MVSLFPVHVVAGVVNKRFKCLTELKPNAKAVLAPNTTVVNIRSLERKKTIGGVGYGYSVTQES